MFCCDSEDPDEEVYPVYDPDAVQFGRIKTTIDTLFEEAENWNDKFDCGTLPVGPCDGSPTIYEVPASHSLAGSQLHKGVIFYSTDCFADPLKGFSSVVLTLHTDGFEVTNPFGEVGNARHSWTPFSIIEEVEDNRTAFRLFALDVSRGRNPHGFNTLATDCNRESWIAEFTGALDVFMTLLFPQHGIVVFPLSGVESTNARIMAGYLIRMSIDHDSFELLYGELSRTGVNQAVLTLYTRESCECIYDTIRIGKKANVGSINAAYSNLFELNEHQFCVRSRQERDIWVRCISNIITKITLGVGCFEEDFRIFRMAVLERVEQLSLPGVDRSLEFKSQMLVVPKEPNPRPLECIEMSPNPSISSFNFKWNNPSEFEHFGDKQSF